mgnify:CR=1 FL=1
MEIKNKKKNIKIYYKDKGSRAADNGSASFIFISTHTQS